MASTVNSGGRRCCLPRHTALTTLAVSHRVRLCPRHYALRVVLYPVAVKQCLSGRRGGGCNVYPALSLTPLSCFVSHHLPLLLPCVCCLPTIAAGCFTGIVSALNRLGKVVVYDTEFNSGDYLREKVADVVKDAMRRLSPPQG
jgi:hypothetical protein